jgi:DNA-binding Lrp family transcriptional regulator
MKLDKKDQRILQELLLNCRQPSTQIARKVGVSREVVDYRIKRLEREGVIRGYIALVNNYQLGLEQYTLFLSLRKDEKVVPYLQKHPHVIWMAICSGMWDVVCTLLTKDKEELEDVIAEITQEIREQLIGYDISLRLKGYKEPLHITKRHQVKIKIDEVDDKILRWLSIDGRMTDVDIAQKIHVSAETIAYRIKKLQHQDTIRSFTALVNQDKLEKLRYAILLEFTNIAEAEPKVKSFCSLKKIHYGDKILSRWNVRIEVLVNNHEELGEFLQELKALFGSLLKSYEVLVIFREVKHIAYYPPAEWQSSK